MTRFTTEVEWHDIRADPDDLPGIWEPVIVTLDMLDGQRRVWMDVSLEEDDNGDVWWCTEALNDFGTVEKTVVWYPVVAWAYAPNPFDIY